MSLRIIICYFLLICAVQANEGGLVIKADPNDAEIYVNGQLKTNSSPTHLLLAEGKYLIEVKKTGMTTESFEILIPAEGVVIKEIKLTPATPVVLNTPPPNPTAPLEKLLYPIRDEFETANEFQQRRENLLKQFNEAVQRHEIAVQAGVATLDKKGYNIDRESFPMHVEWAEWVKKFNLSEVSVVMVNRDDARTLWTEGAQKPVFLNMRLDNAGVTPLRQFIVAQQHEWTAAKYTQLSLKSAKQIDSIAFNHNGTILVAHNIRGSMWVWNLNSGQQISDLPAWTSGQLVHFHPTKPLITRVSGNSTYIENVQTGKQEQTFSTSFFTVFDTAFSPDGKILAVANSLQITFWEVESGVTVTTFKGFDDAFLRIAYALDGKTIATLHNQKIQILDAADGKVIKSFERDKLTSEQLLENTKNYYPSLFDNFVANTHYQAGVSLGKQAVILTDGVTHERYLMAGQNAEISVIVLSPDGQWLAAGRVDGTIDLWKLL